MRRSTQFQERQRRENRSGHCQKCAKDVYTTAQRPVAEAASATQQILPETGLCANPIFPMNVARTARRAAAAHPVRPDQPICLTELEQRLRQLPLDSSFTPWIT